MVTITAVAVAGIIKVVITVTDLSSPHPWASVQ